MKYSEKYLKLSLALAGLLVNSQASALVIDINTYVTGNPVTTNATVATLTLTQNGSSVDFTFTNSVNNLAGNIGDDAFISALLFSYDGTPSLDKSSFTNFGGSQLVTAGNFQVNPPGGGMQVTISIWTSAIPLALRLRGLLMANSARGQLVQQMVSPLF